MFVAWVLFPLVVLVVCLGCGLLVERLAGWALPGPVVPSVGLALVIIAASLTTTSATITHATTVIVVVLAIAGYASSWRRVRGFRVDRWALGVGVAVYAVFAAPIVLSGNATFLGYLVLNDTAFHMSMIDQLLAHGHDLSGVPNSSFYGVVNGYLSTSYPSGAQVGLGALRPLLAQDVAWVYQPYLAVVLTLGGVAVYELLKGVVSSRPLRSVCAFVAAQAGLVYAYYLSGSIKELATTWIITVTVVLVFATLRRAPGIRSLVPLLVASVAGLYVLNLAIVPWLGPPLAVFAVAAGWRARHVIRRAGSGRAAVAIAGGAALVAILVAPLISRVSTFVSTATAVLTEQSDLGNLIAPLQKWQIMGIWPSGDFRMPVTTHYRVTYALIGVAIASAVLGALWLIRRRAFAPLTLIVGNAIAAAYLLSRSSPYASGKVMMIFSLTAVLAAMLGAASLYASRRRVEGWLLAAVIAGGVLWTNALAFHDASIASRPRLDELASIGSRFAGQRPAFFNISDEYAIHFLRDEAPTDPVWQPPLARPGVVRTTADQKYAPWDPDQLTLPYIESFRLLVIARSPLASRPPANFRLAYQGRYYDVWRRTGIPQVLDHVPLGAGGYAQSVPACRVVLATAALAKREHARIAYFAPPKPVIAEPPNTAEPSATAAVPQAGRYQVWLGGLISDQVAVSVGGQRIGSVSDEVERPGQFIPIGKLSLVAGLTPVTITREGGDLDPGSGRQDFLWPVALVPDTHAPSVQYIAADQARSLCGRSLDWLEVVR